MFNFETFLCGSMSAITFLILIALIVIIILLKRNGITTIATIVKIEEKEKYKDSSISKHIAYDYVYKYVDCNRQEQLGILRKNTPHIEFNIGDHIEIVYIKYWSHLSVYKARYDSLYFLPWMVVFILCVLLFILFVNL